MYAQNAIFKNFCWYRRGLLFLRGNQKPNSCQSRIGKLITCPTIIYHSDLHIHFTHNIKKDQPKALILWPKIRTATGQRSVKMKKWIIAVIVNVFLICAGAEDGMCCNKMKYLIQKKKRAFAIVCAPGNTALRRCCNNIKKGVMSLENAYCELCKKKSGKNNMVVWL